MVKYVIAGKSNCPFYARIELLADELQQRLPDFSVHKIVVTPDSWPTWVENTCIEKGWEYDGQSPMVWRELINRGGKGILVGGSNDFLEIAKGYYGITNDKITEELQQIAEENTNSKVIYDEQEEKRTTCCKPYKITVTDAHSDLAYNLLPQLCSTYFSKDVKDIHLTLYSSQMDREKDLMEALSMELVDCAFPELRKVILEEDLNRSFNGSDLIIIVNSSDVSSDMKLLKEYGQALQGIKNETKVVVVGLQSVIACNIILRSAGEINKENIFALTRLVENHAKASIAKKLSVNTPDISQLVVWGSSLEFILDHSSARAGKYDGAVWAPHLDTFSHSVNEMVYDKSWFATELPQVMNVFRNETDNDDVAEMESQTKNRFHLAHSGAVISQLRFILDDRLSGMFSLGIPSNGFCDIPEGLVFSVPCDCIYGKVFLKTDLDLDSSTKEKIAAAAANLQEYCNELMKI